MHAVASVLLGLGGLVAGQAAAIALLAAGIVLLMLGEVAHSAACGASPTRWRASGLARGRSRSSASAATAPWSSIP